MMDVYVRKVRISDSWFRGPRILFEYYLVDRWRKGNILYTQISPSVVADVSSLISSFVSDKLSKFGLSVEEIIDRMKVAEQFNKDSLQNCTKIRIKEIKK